jgi:two-component system, LytTR family, response regulator
MPQITGVEAIALLEGANPRPLVVFLTAHVEHAVFAFDAGAIDYIVKPIDAGRLAKAIARARERLSARAESAAPKRESESPDLERLAVPTRRGLVIVKPEELRYAIVDGESVILHTVRGAFVTDFRIVALEKKLPSDQFVRVHRRALVNLEHVTQLEPVGAGVYVAELSDGANVPVSRQAARLLKSRWRID